MLGVAIALLGVGVVLIYAAVTGADPLAIVGGVLRNEGVAS